MEDNKKFQIGDKVEAFGCPGKVLAIDNFVHVQWDDLKLHFDYFHLDGKLHQYHQDPTLKFVSRLKKRVKKEITYHLVFNYHGDLVASSNLRADLNYWSNPHEYQTVQCTSTVEVNE